MWRLALVWLLLPACHLALPLDGPGEDAAAAREAGGDGLRSIDGAVGCSGFTSFLKCDDFEDPWAPAYELYHGDDAVAPERVSPGHASEYALRTSSGPAFGWSIVHLGLSPPVTTGALSVRAYVSLSAAPVPTWVSVFQLVDKDVDGLTKAGFDVGPGDQVHVHCPSHGWVSDKGHVMTQGDWHCVELRVDMDATAVELWIDGSLVEDCGSYAVVWPAGGFASVKVGAGTDQSKATVTLDDVVVARGPIGCP